MSYILEKQTNVASESCSIEIWLLCYLLDLEKCKVQGRGGGGTKSKKKMCMLIMQYRFLVFQLSINILQVSYNKKEKNKLTVDKNNIYIYIYIFHFTSPVKTLKTIFRSSHFEKFSVLRPRHAVKFCVMFWKQLCSKHE